MSSELIEVDLDDQVKEKMIIDFALDHFSDPSREVFLDYIWDNGRPFCSFEDKLKLAIQAMAAGVVNEVANHILREKMEIEDRDNGIFYFF